MYFLQDNTLQNDSTYIVGIGASAGGLEAINELFDHVTQTEYLAFIVVQHLSSDYKSLLVELLAKHTDMPVNEAEDYQEIRPGNVYVIPNNKELTVQNGYIRLEKKEFEKGPNTAIDTFYQSLAQDQRNCAIAVLLSGTGTDGTKGIEAVKNNGGFVIVQDPDTAKFDGMPKNAISSGYVDSILPPYEIYRQISNYVEGTLPYKTPESKKYLGSVQNILTSVFKKTGYDFLQYKQPTILRRIARRLDVLGIPEIDDYEQFLKKDEKEAELLAKEFFIGVTSFFRDKDAFNCLYNNAILKLVESRDDHDSLKVWVTACSTGEEAYSVAILIDKALKQLDKLLEVKIFASDIDKSSIELASKGKFSRTQLLGVDKKTIHDYFTKTEDGYYINSRIRKQIVFATHDILKDPPFIKNDFVSCRNLLIYLNPPLQEVVLNTLHFALNPGGYLFLGTSENPAPLKRGFLEIDNKWKIYQRTPENKPFVRKTTGTSRIKPVVPVPGIQKNKIDVQIADDFKKALVDNLGYAGVYVNENYEVKEGIGNFRKYLSLPERLHILNILKMAPPELSGVLSTLLRKALKENKPQSSKNIKVSYDKKIALTDIFIYPPSETISGVYSLVVFADSIVETDKIILTGAVEEENAEGKNQYMLQLEEELRETRNNLQLAVEGLETTNEELQSSNEELQSANEELQSSNEELQSLNEELHTLNTEHQARIKELVELNDDMTNYLQTSMIGQVFLDQKLCLRRFNKAASEVINVIESDIGRPITHITSKIKSEAFIESIHKVSKSGVPIEKEYELEDGSVYLTKIQPYLRQDRVRDGIIITLVNITTTKSLNRIIKSVFEASINPIFIFEAIRKKNKVDDFACVVANDEAYRTFGKNINSQQPTLAKNFPELSSADFIKKTLEVIKAGRPALIEINLKKNNRVLWYQASLNKLQDGFVLILSDVTSRKEAEDKLQKNFDELLKAKESLRELNDGLEKKVMERTSQLESIAQQFKFVTDFIPQMVWSADARGSADFFNQRWYEFTGLTFEQSKDSGWLSVIHEDDKDKARAAWLSSVKKGNPYKVEYRMRRSNGVYSWVLAQAYLMKDARGKKSKWFGTCTDINEQKEAEQILEQKIEERTSDLKLLNEKLETSNSDLMQFASVASHDLKEPLRKIHFFSELIKNKFPKETKGEILGYIERITNAAGRATNLISDVLSYSRLSSDNLIQNVNLNELVRDILQDLELVIHEKDAVVEVARLPVIQAVPGQMRQLFQNIITNALKFQKEKQTPKIVITCETLKQDKRSVLQTGRGKIYKIAIKDNGIGFDEQYSKKIFSLFQRLHNKDDYDGTGIGLAIASKIVERHKGYISATGKEGDGAEFTIVLPERQDLLLDIKR